MDRVIPGSLLEQITSRKRYLASPRVDPRHWRLGGIRGRLARLFDMLAFHWQNSATATRRTLGQGNFHSSESVTRGNPDTFHFQFLYHSRKTTST